MSTIHSQHTNYTSLPPSCVQFSPQDANLLVLGTYSLNESASTLAGQKTGSLCLYTHTPELKLLQTLPTQAILDLKFSPHTPDALAIAQSLGLLSFYRLADSTLTHIATYTLFSPEVLVLSLTFSPSSADLLALSLSSGEVVLFSLQSGGVVYRYRPHELEAWTCEFSSDGETLYSGGDDSVFCAQSIESDVLLWRDRRTHQAGVTAILAWEGEGRILTGSYDEWLRVFDSRTRRVADDIRITGGGVWRLCMRDGESLLASCMHAGARIVTVAPGKPLSVVAKFEEHESMNYGSHIHPGSPDRVVSCSFYDKRLCIWSI